MRCRAEPPGQCPRGARTRSKKKKRKPKAFASSSGGDTSLLVGKQGRNVPRAAFPPTGDNSQHNPRRLAPRSEDGLPDLGSILPNLDGNSSHQAAADEKDWQFLADDLMQDNGDDLLASSSQAAASVPSAATAGDLINLGRTTPLTGIQRALHAARLKIRQEEGGDQDPNCVVDYDGDSSNEDSPAAEEIQSSLAPAAGAEIQSNIAPVATEIQNSLAPEAAEFQSSLNPTAAEFQISPETPVAEFQSNLATSEAEFQSFAAPSLIIAIQGSHAAPASASPPPITDGSKDKEGAVATREERSIERRTTLLSRRAQERGHHASGQGEGHQGNRKA